MTIQFTCKACGLKNVPVEIAERGAAESLARWMELVQRVVGLAHAERSPRCCSGAVDLRIPLPKDAIGVGFK